MDAGHGLTHDLGWDDGYHCITFFGRPRFLPVARACACASASSGRSFMNVCSLSRGYEGAIAKSFGPDFPVADCAI